MPHIDDGTLHAWLDGAIDALAAAGALPDGMQAGDVAAHFERCADCRARLEREREVRERAGLVLRAAAPSQIDTPPLSTATSTVRPHRTWIPVAWAASLLMAVGAGWWGSQIARDPRAFSESSVEAREAQDALPPVDLPAPAAPAAQTGAPNLDEEERTAPLQGLDASAGRSTAAQRATAGDTDLVGPRDVSVTPSAFAAPRREAAGAPQGQVADAAPAPRTPSRVPLGRTAATEPMAQAPPPAIAPPPPPPPVAFKLRAAPPAAAAAETAERGSSAQTIDAAMGFVARDSAGLLPWTNLSAGPVLGIHDAEILSADRTEEMGAGALRVTQRLGTGDTIEVLSWTAQLTELQGIVITRDRAVQSRTPVQSGEAASTAAGPFENSRLRLNLIRTRTIGSRTRELLFTMTDGWVLVRAPTWLDADDVRARLGAVSVAPAAR